ncbi:uncharacterized protein [Rutidosis leptorrhynchoides]|uniref:uncharacterized protein n=1 Tax=Rutidosis leptorrhynchoides TaxID=125765 RepID=UPI003A99450B
MGASGADTLHLLASLFELDIELQGPKVRKLTTWHLNYLTISPPPDSSYPVVVAVITGAFLFVADLVRNIKLPVTVDFVRAESYGSGTVSSGAPKLSCNLKLDVAGKHVC